MKRFCLSVGVALLIGSMGEEAGAGRVGFWKGEGNATDEEGNSNGILLGGTTFATAAVGQGFQLDGVNDQVRIPDVNAFDVTNLTVAFWFKPTVNAVPVDEDLVGKNALNALGWGFAADTQGNGNRQVKFRAFGSSGPTLGAVIATDASSYLNHFFHVTGTVQTGGDIKLYINGAEFASQAFPGTLVTNNLDIDVSHATGGAYFGGLIDELQIWDRALSANEVANLLPEPSTATFLLASLVVLSRRWRR